MSIIDFIQVGVGNRGAQILTDLTRSHSGRYKPVGFVDVIPQFLDAARSMPDGRIVPGYATLLEALHAHPDAHAVIIATPANLHSKLIRQALDAQRHVWVEKPLTYDLAEARSLADIAALANGVVVVGNQYQYHPLERRLQALVHSDRFGKPFLISYQHHRYRPEMRTFTGPYPALWEQGVHSLDSILALVGDANPITVYATGLRPPHSSYNSDTVTNILTGFSNDVQAHLLVTFDSQRTDWSIRVECEKAALLLEADGWNRARIEIVSREETSGWVTAEDPVEPGLFDGPPMTDTFEAFHRQISEGVEAPTSIARNLRTIEWIDGAVRSLESGDVIHLRQT